MAKVEKKQMDVITDLPDDVRAKIPSKEGKRIWLSSYKRSYSEGATEAVACARGWHYLEMAGFAPDEYGEWIKPGDEGSEENMFKLFEKFMRVFKDPKNQEEITEELSREIDEEAKDMRKDDNFEIQADIVNKNEDQRLVFGWASIIEEDGKLVIDRHNDVIKMEDLTQAAHDFITEYREAKAMHKGDRIGDVVQSVIIDDDFAKSHDIPHKKRGWWIAMKIHDDKSWDDIKKGRFTAFSIGGKAVPIEIE